MKNFEQFVDGRPYVPLTPLGIDSVSGVDETLNS